MALQPADDSKVKTIFADADFVAAPTPSPDGEHLAWITWNSPYIVLGLTPLCT